MALQNPRELVYNSRTGVATVEYDTGRQTNISEGASTLEVVAADDIQVRVDGELTTVRSLDPTPLFVYTSEEEGRIDVRTESAPEYDDEKDH